MKKIIGIPENYENHRMFEEAEARRTIMTMFGIYSFLGLTAGVITGWFWFSIIFFAMAFFMADPVKNSSKIIDNIRVERAVLQDRAMEKMMFDDED